MAKGEASEQDSSTANPRDAARPEQIAQGPHAHPPVDVIDRPGEILLRADMAGAKPDGIDVRFEGGVLVLAARARKAEEESRDYLIREFAPMDFYREFTVGEGVDREKISAEYDAGVLTLHLPKSEPSKPRRIDVRRK
jgi:HSP20 family protein